MSQDINNTIATSKTRRVIKNLRWYVLVLFLLGVTVNYITRNSLGILAPELKESLGITTEQYSWIVGAFQIAYTIFQPLCGWLIDVIGLKIGFMVCAGIWALMCIFHAGAGSWLHLAILRFFMGASEAAATPANAKTIGEWFPKSERPVAAGWAGVGFSIGGFGHQIISCMLSALVVESFDKGQMATVNGMRGSAAWIASFLFSLLIGVTADKIGFNPLFIAMGFFDLIGAVFLVAFIAERRAKRA